MQNKRFSDELVKLLGDTVEACGASLSDSAAALMLDDLSGYSDDQVMAALARCRKEMQGRLSVAAIISRIDDGRVGPEEAWAMIPKNEAETAVITDEMGAAWEIARGLYRSDEVAARMSFREAYTRIVGQNRAAGVCVTWYPSFGHYIDGRSEPIREAIRLGRIGSEFSQLLLPAGDSIPALPPPIPLEPHTEAPEQTHHKESVGKTTCSIHGDYAPLRLTVKGVYMESWCPKCIRPKWAINIA